jgi:tRNA (guanine37-N1)-methyltransferase
MSGTPAPVRATPSDAAEVLVLQRCCWIGEAIANNDLAVPPLKEPLDQVRAWMPDAWVLRESGRLIGAVRGTLDGDVWKIGRLMVAPDRQGEGLGGMLLRHAEGHAPAGAAWFELFTGAASIGNLDRYRHAGYREVFRSGGLVVLRKPVSPGPITSPS